eukprot:m.344240 g.344240  ORF g.344240 m.344240 type:complete len:184 (+) comp19853_c0_seq10:2991-3542(+)
MAQCQCQLLGALPLMCCAPTCNNSAQTYPVVLYIFGDLILFFVSFLCDPFDVKPQLAADWSRLRAVRKLVFRAIQEAKEAGVVAGSSDASVVVSCEPGLATLLRSFENRGESNLSNVFVCSEALVGDTLGPINGHVFRAEDAHEGLVTVAVSKTQRTKCPRCWRFVSSETDALCSRCATIVQQ